MASHRGPHPGRHSRSAGARVVVALTGIGLLVPLARLQLRDADDTARFVAEIVDHYLARRYGAPLSEPEDS